MRSIYLVYEEEFHLLHCIVYIQTFLWAKVCLLSLYCPTFLPVSSDYEYSRICN